VNRNCGKAIPESDTTAKTVRWLLRQINFYHFHDTSRRSPLRTRPFADTSGDYLRSDGSNLPVFLLGLQESSDEGSRAAWRLIEATFRRVAPFIAKLTPIEDRQGNQARVGGTTKVRCSDRHTFRTARSGRWRWWLHWGSLDRACPWFLV